MHVLKITSSNFVGEIGIEPDKQTTADEKKGWKCPPEIQPAD